MKTEIRRNQILAILRAIQTIVTVDELASILKVSPLTIRRDLKTLEGQHAIIRTHGGCMLAGRVGLETNYHRKVAKNFNLKQAIGKTAVNIIQPGEVILIDDGSTTFHLATHLHQRRPLTVYTNSLALVSELTRYPDIKLNILGGYVNAGHFSVSGFLTEQNIKNIVFDKVFLGVDSIDEAGNCYINHDDTAKLMQLMMNSGRERILLGDHTKIGTRGVYIYGTLDDMDAWVTSSGITPMQLKTFGEKVKIIVAKSSDK